MKNKIKEFTLKASARVKTSTNTLLKDESGNGLIISIILGAVLVLAAVAFAPSLQTWFSTLGTYITGFFDTEIKSILK